MEETKKPEENKSGRAKTEVVSNLLLALVSVFFGGFLWALLIALGFGSSGSFDYSGGFFAAVGENFAAAFGSVANIVASTLDIAMFMLLVFCIFRFLAKNNASLLLRFIIPLVIIAIICTSKLLDFPVMGYIFSNIIIILIIAVLIMFPQELRRYMWKLASPNETESFSADYDCSEEDLRRAVVDIVKAVLNMSKNNEGALIVVATQNMPEHIIDSGTRLDAVLSQHLIECLFNTKANLHDGAVFIHGNRLVAAGCFLPLTQSGGLPKELGTRHRAAMGVSEQYPVMVIVVSEETGVISVFKKGQMERYFDGEMLSEELLQEFGLKAVPSKKKKGRKLFR